MWNAYQGKGPGLEIAGMESSPPYPYFCAVSGLREPLSDSVHIITPICMQLFNFS